MFNWLNKIMAKRITNLPTATVPLVGNEVFAVAQTGTTKQVPISSLGGSGGGGSDVSGLSSNWQNSYSSVNSLSAGWELASTSMALTSMGGGGSADYNKFVKWGPSGGLSARRIIVGPGSSAIVISPPISIDPNIRPWRINISNNSAIGDPFNGFPTISSVNTVAFTPYEGGQIVGGAGIPYATDVAAASAGIVVGGLYHTATGDVKIRLT